MRFALWMVLAAAVLPYVVTGIAKAGGGYDNARPRAWQEGLGAWRQRADWAHRNAFEAFPAFAAAVLLAAMAHARPGLVAPLAGAFIAARVGHAACYMLDRPMLRSACWAVGFGCVVAIFVAGVAAF